jgi:hypothetical protein
MGLLNARDIRAVDEFKPTDVRVSDVDLLGSDAGLKNLVSRGQDAQYNPGMAAFDVRALQKTKGFNEGISSLRDQQDALLRDAGSRGAGLRKQIEDYGRSQLDSAQKNARSYLGGKSSSLAAQNEAEARDYNDRLARLDLAEIARSKALPTASQSARGQLGQMNPYADRFLDPSTVNAADYVRRGANRSASDFISNDEASEFNNIMALLGNGGQSWTASSAIPAAEENYIIDNQGLERAMLNNALSSYGKYKTDTLNQMAAIRGDSQRNADGMDLTYQNQLKSEEDKQWLREQAKAAFERSNLDPRLKDASLFATVQGIPNYDLKSNTLNDKMNLAKYLNAAPSQDLGWQNVLSQTDADRLNEMARSIGQADTYSAGNYDPNNRGPRFNEAAFLSDLMPLLSAERQRRDAAEAEAMRAASAQNQGRTRDGVGGVLNPKNLPGMVRGQDPLSPIVSPVADQFSRGLKNPF